MRFRSVAAFGVVAVAMLGVAGSASAQSQDHAGAGVGIKAGVAFPAFNGTNVKDAFDGKTGFQGGLFLGGSRGKVLSPMIEFNVVNKKASYFGAATNLWYLDIPVLLRVGGGAKTHGGLNLYGIVGPAFDIKIGDDLKDVANIDDAWEGFDIGIVGGGGIEITRFIIEARGNWGLRNVNKNLTGLNEIKTRTFSVLFGIRFN
jgi:hypothetical protein